MSIFDIEVGAALAEAAAAEQKQSLTKAVELPVWNGQIAGVSAFHMEHMPHKVLELLQAAIELAKAETEFTFELFSIVFNDETVIDETDEDPVLVQGTYLAEAKSVVIRTGSIWESVTERVHGDDCNVSLLATLWVNLLIVPLHELGHCIGAHLETPDVSDVFAEDMAGRLLVKLASRFDIEPNVEGLPEPMRMLYDTDLKACAAAGDAHLNRLVTLAKDGLVFLSKDGRISVSKLRTYIKAVYQSKEYIPAEEWNQAVVAAPALIANPAIPPTGPTPIENNNTQTSTTYGPPEPTDMYYGSEDTGTYGGETPPPFDQPADQQTGMPSQQDQNQPPNIGDSGLSAEQTASIQHKVLMRLYHHLFTKCDPQADGSFRNPWGIVEPVNIADIPGANHIFLKMDVMSQTGRITQDIWNNQNPGCVCGSVGKNSNLPMYHLWINRGGVMTKISILPQNPNKMKGNSLSAWAQRARAGHRIAMVMIDGEGCVLRIETAPGTDLSQAYYGTPFNNN